MDMIKKILTTFLSVLSFLSLAVLPFPSLAQKCNPQDRKALLKILGQLYTSFNSEFDCCDTSFVQCDPKTHRVTGIQVFADPNLTGHIPEAISELPYLELVMFHKLSLTGNIPQSITKLEHLTFLDLSWNHLSGPIPEFLYQLDKLYFLDLSFNNFSGSIPPSLSMFRNLLALHLDRNNLTGIIPDSFGQFKGKTPDLYLSHNRLTGQVPRSLGGLNFTALDFSRNMLQGDISFLFGTNKTIQILDFSRNMLQFDLSQVKFPESLTSLDLNHNSITGSLPQGLVNLTLYGFNVSYNRLCGEIPTGGRLQTLDYTAYFHNRCLCGAPLPECK